MTYEQLDVNYILLELTKPFFFDKSIILGLKENVFPAGLEPGISTLARVTRMFSFT